MYVLPMRPTYVRKRRFGIRDASMASGRQGARTWLGGLTGRAGADERSATRAEERAHVRNFWGVFKYLPERLRRRQGHRRHRQDHP